MVRPLRLILHAFLHGILHAIDSCMSKTKYAIPTPQGLITRTSNNNEYAFIVIAGRFSVENSKKNYALSLANAKAELARADISAEWRAKMEGALAQTEERYVAKRRDYVGGCRGFTSRLDLANALARKTREEGFDAAEIEIVAILPAHKTEVKARAKKAVAGDYPPLQKGVDYIDANGDES